MAVSVSLSQLINLAFFPHCAFGYDDERIVARIIFLVFHQKRGDACEIKWVFRNQTASGRYIGGVQSGKTSIAAKDAENPDALMRTQGRSLPSDRFFGARDRRGESDAILGAVNVVIHRFGNADHWKSGARKHCREAQRVVASNGDQTSYSQPFQILHDDRCEIIVLPVERKF